MLQHADTRPVLDLLRESIKHGNLESLIESLEPFERAALLACMARLRCEEACEA